MNRTTLALCLAFVIRVPGPSWASGGTESRPNILFILCDDLGYGDVGVHYQNRRAALNDRSVPYFTTPSIDTLARDGVKLTQHYCGAPVCAPSRASLLTGRTQGHANVRDNQFDKALADTHTLGNVLQQAGYATALIGKWGLQGRGGGSKSASPDRPLAEKQADYAAWAGYPTRRGFDFYFGYVRHKDGHYHYPKEDGREVWENDREVSAGLDLCFTTDLFTARAKKWIVDHRDAHPQQPFLLFLAYDTPHAVLHHPPCAFPEGGGLRGGLQWTGEPGSMINTATGVKDSWVHPDYREATWDNDRDPSTAEVPWPDVQKRYANNVRRIDDCVGDLLQLLKHLRIDENTLVVFTSDNGPSRESYLEEDYVPSFFRGFGPFDGIKRDTWEGGLREPALARWPRGIPAGRVTDRPSGQWDWLATFAELAGVPAPAASDGVSLLPALTGQGDPRQGTLYVEYFNNRRTPDYPEFAPAHRGRRRGQMQVVHMDGYKGVRYDIRSANDDFEIYNLAKDPQETRNLADQAAFAGLQARMKARVLQVRKAEGSAKRPYDDAPVPPLEKPPSSAPGLTRSLFKGEWPWVPDYRTLTPDDRDEVSGIELPALEPGQKFGVAFEGFVYAEQDGVYTFTLENDTGATLFVHEIRVFQEPFRGSAPTLRGEVHLQAGWHPLRLYSRHGSDAARLDLSCQLADVKAVPLSAGNLRRAERPDES